MLALRSFIVAKIEKFVNLPLFAFTQFLKKITSLQIRKFNFGNCIYLAKLLVLKNHDKKIWHF